MTLWRSLLKAVAAVVLLTALTAPPLHGASPRGGAEGLLVVELCGSGGIVQIALVPGGEPAAPETPVDEASPCLLCHALPAVALPGPPSVPSLDRLSPRRDLTQADRAPPRPPLGRSIGHPPTAPPALA